MILPYFCVRSMVILRIIISTLYYKHTDLKSMFRISRHAAYALVGDGYIPAVKVANAFRIPKINVINYVLSEKKAAPSEA